MRAWASLLLILSQVLALSAQGQITFGQVNVTQNCIWHQTPSGPPRVQFYQDLSTIIETGPIFSKHRVVIVTAGVATDAVRPIPPITPNVTFLGVPAVSDFIYGFKVGEQNCITWETAILKDLVALADRQVDAVLTRYSITLAGADGVRIFPRERTMAFAYKGTFTVTSNSALLPSSQTDYPLLLSLSDVALKQTGSGGQVTQADADDVNFFSDSGLTSLLSWEIEAYDGTAGTMTVWVKTPTLSTSLVIYAGIGDSGITTFQGGDPWKTTYEMVQHMGQATDAQAVDSTANNNDSDSSTATQAAGVIGNGQVFASAGSDVINIPYPADISSATKVTWSAWFKRTAADNNVAFGNGTSIGVTVYGSGLDLIFARIVNQDVTVPSESTDLGWHLIHVVFDGTASGNSNRLKIYLDGAPMSVSFGGTTIPAAMGTTADDFRIGQDQIVGGSYSNGTMDEVRLVIADIVSADWAKIDYNSQVDNATFVSKSYAANGGGAAFVPYPHPRGTRAGMHSLGGGLS